MPTCLEISFCSLEEKNKWGFQWIWLSLGQAKYAFCLNLCKWWVSFGFNFNGTWLCKLWLQIQSLSTVKEKRTFWLNFEEIGLNQKITLRLFPPLLFPSNFFIIWCLLSLSLSLKIKRLIHGWIINIDFSITQVFILF